VAITACQGLDSFASHTVGRASCVPRLLGGFTCGYREPGACRGKFPAVSLENFTSSRTERRATFLHSGLSRLLA
jgi:hypothetical protein